MTVNNLNEDKVKGINEIVRGDKKLTIESVTR